MADNKPDPPGRWDIDGPEYKDHFSDPAHAPPQGDDAWSSLPTKEKQDLMWTTPVAKGTDAAWSETPEGRRKDMLEMLEEHGAVRAWSNTKAFQEMEKNMPGDVRSFHLKDGTTIFRKMSPSQLIS